MSDDREIAFLAKELDRTSRELGGLRNQVYALQFVVTKLVDLVGEKRPDAFASIQAIMGDPENSHLKEHVDALLEGLPVHGSS